MTTHHLIADLRRDEGVRNHAYVDSLGNLTIGVGHLLPKGTAPNLTWTDAQIDAALRADIAVAELSLDHAEPWWRNLDDVRQDALCNACFNLGITRLLGFRHMLAALRAGDYDEAARQALDSTWAAQVGERASRIAAMMRTGERS